MDYQHPTISKHTQAFGLKKICSPQNYWIAPPLPELQAFPEEVILEVAHWCLDPASLLNLSSTCREFANILRVAKVWLSHHWGRGYDIGVLAKKAARAASAENPQYGRDGWGKLVKSAFDKAEFPDDEHLTQWKMGKPLPHAKTARELDPHAIEKYQARGDRWMQVLYDVLTEHERWNLELYPFLHDEALQIRVKNPKSRYLQALLAASEMLIRMWIVPIACFNGIESIKYAQKSLDEVRGGNGPSQPPTTINSLMQTFLIAKKIMEVFPESQTQRRLFPHPPFGPAIWEGPNGDIPADGLGWLRKVIESWQGRVYVVGQYTINPPLDQCYYKLKLGQSVFRMCLDFKPDGTITGRGGDFGGKFNIVSGVYHKTFVKFVKQYDDDEDPDAYEAQGHMTPWGVYGTWGRPEDSKTVRGFWVMWHFEGAPIIQQSELRDEPRVPMFPKQAPYKAEAGWFEEYERQRDRGEFRERSHDTIPPPDPLDIPLPEIDAFGL